MADAGLTHGGFYAHFASKDELVREALAASLLGTRERWAGLVAAARGRGESGLEAIVRYYLRPAHRDNPEAGCSIAALAPEIARRDAKSRDRLSEAVDEIVATIAAELPPELPAEKARDTATAIFGLMMGSLQIARVTRMRAASEAVLRAPARMRPCRSRAAAAKEPPDDLVPPRRVSRPPQHPLRLGRRGVTFLTMLATAGAVGAPGVLILPLQREFGWDTAEISTALAIRLLLFGLMGPFAAALMNRFGVRRIALSALVLIATGLLAVARS